MALHLKLKDFKPMYQLFRKNRQSIISDAIRLLGTRENLQKILAMLNQKCYLVSSFKLQKRLSMRFPFLTTLAFFLAMSLLAGQAHADFDKDTPESIKKLITHHHTRVHVNKVRYHNTNCRYVNPSSYQCSFVAENRTEQFLQVDPVLMLLDDNNIVRLKSNFSHVNNKPVHSFYLMPMEKRLVNARLMAPDYKLFHLKPYVTSNMISAKNNTNSTYMPWQKDYFFRFPPYDQKYIELFDRRLANMKEEYDRKIFNSIKFDYKFVKEMTNYLEINITNQLELDNLEISKLACVANITKSGDTSEIYLDTGFINLKKGNSITKQIPVNIDCDSFELRISQAILRYDSHKYDIYENITFGENIHFSEFVKFLIIEEIAKRQNINM